MASPKESSSTLSTIVENKEQLKIDAPDTEIKTKFINKVVKKLRNFFSNIDITKHSCQSRIIRILIVTAAAIATIYVCMLSSQRYMHSWVQTVIESTDVHVSEIPFPAVTICPIESFNQSRLQLAREKFFGSNDSTTNGMDFVSLIRGFYHATWASFEDDPISQQSDDDIETDYDHISKFPWDAVDLNDFLTFMSYTCEEIFEACTWRRVKVNCCYIFKKIQTYKGACFSFNSILTENPYRTWPWKLSEAGIGTGLKVKLRNNITQRLRKIAAMIHDPNESLSTDIIYMDGERVIAAVSPLRFTAEEDIRSLDPEYRHCYFMNELQLLGKSTSECIRDCHMKYIELKCNCTYFFTQAAKTGYHSYPICGSSHMKCIYQHRGALMTTGNIIEDRVSNNITTFDCKCYPNCNYIRYSTAVYSDNTGAIENNLSINLQVYYQQDTLFSYHSMLRYTLLDLLVAYGGIAGLFLGISLIGIAEALTRRITCWSRHDEVENESNEEYIDNK